MAVNGGHAGTKKRPQLGPRNFFSLIEWFLGRGALIFLSLLFWKSLFFFSCKDLLAIWVVFSFLPKNFRGSPGKKILAFPVFFSGKKKNLGAKRPDWCESANRFAQIGPSKVLLVLPLQGDPPSRRPCHHCLQHPEKKIRQHSSHHPKNLLRLFLRNNLKG